MVIERIYADLSVQVAAAVPGVYATATGLGMPQSSLFAALSYLRHESCPPFDVLVDLTLVDRLGQDFEHRFAAYYQLCSSEAGQRIGIEVFLSEAVHLPSCVGLWPAADWLENEVSDLFGCSFAGRSDLEPLLSSLPGAHPLRKDYEDEAQLASVALVAPAVPVAPEPVEEEGEVELLDLGPHYPVWARAFSMALYVEGDRVRRVVPNPGLAHAGLEKIGETLPYAQGVELGLRLGPRSARAGALAFVLASERLLGIEAPPRAQAVRAIGAEMERIAAHLAWLADVADLAGAGDACRYAWQERAKVMHLLAAIPAACIAGINTDFSEQCTAPIQDLCAQLPAVLKALEAALLEQGFWSDRASGIGVLSAASALAWSASGPVLRASGIGADVRLDIPYCDYAADSFLAPVGECGDAWDRCRIRVREMAQSAELVAARLRVLPGGDWRLTDEKIAPAPLPGLRDAEAMIHHFGAWMYGHGLQPPEGKTAFVSVEAPAGELACFVASDGSDRPCRLHFRSPSLLHLQLFPRLVEGLSLEQTALVWGSLGISAAEADR